MGFNSVFEGLMAQTKQDTAGSNCDLI